MQKYPVAPLCAIARQVGLRMALVALLISSCASVRPAVVGPSTLTVTTAKPTASSSSTSNPMRDGLVNLGHLNFLAEEVEINSTPMLLTHIYAEAPRYEWTDASGEGIAALDDTARATLVYLDYYRATQDKRALQRAQRGLNFVRYMQADDDSGEFYNFVTDRAGTINRAGITSYKSLDWWAMRGLWALARGYAVFKEIDPTYAAELRQTYLRTERALQASIFSDSVGKMIKVHGFDVPAWLPGGAADRLGIAVLALAEFQQAEPNDDTAKLLKTLADGIAAFQLGGPGEYPFAMHPDTTNAPGFWHAWGSHQAAALAFAGQVMKRQAWIDSAAREARTFFGWQLAGGLMKEIGTLPVREGQIAYSVNTLVQALMNLHRATHDASYARMGGLVASWFFGNNFAQMPMYDPQTGRGLDGIDAALKVNQNSGAESTIEALMALQAVTSVPEAARYLQYKAQSHETGWKIIEAESGQEVAGKPAYGQRGWTGEANISNGHYYELRLGDAIEITFDAPANNDYWLYVSHMRRALPKLELRVEAIPAQPIQVDAQFDEWVNAPQVFADQSAQIVRGAQAWRGPQQDSFGVRTMWDQDKLYLAVAVRDSLVGDEGTTGPSGEDAVWVYLDGRGTGARLSAKFTLGHTNKGGQAWDWHAGFWLPKAEVAWRKVEGGYAYEAAIPWASLGVRDAKTGQRLGIEVGRGVGGNSFMDLGGRDPDSANNLVPLMLVEQAQSAVATSSALSPTQITQTNDVGAVAFNISINTGSPFTVSESVSPDRDYLWLDRVNAQPISLKAGSHVLRVSYMGSNVERAALVDAFMLVPRVLTRLFNGPDGKSLTLHYEMSSGELIWDDQ